MKHFLTTALLCGTAILAAQAQNVIVVDKDGVSHKYKADDVQEITFEKIEAPDDPTKITFDNVAVTPWNDKNFMLQFFQGDFVIQLDAHQPSAYFMQPGEYVVRSENEQGGFEDFSIDKDWYWIGDYPTQTEQQMTLTGGTLNVDLEGDVYTMDLDLSFDGADNIRGTYTGTINKFGPTLDYNLTSCNAVEVNEPAPNGFYYRFADSNYSLEMRLDFFCDGFSLKPGTYTFSDTYENGTASSKVDIYSPYVNTKFKEGTVTVSESDGKTVVEIDGTLDTGMKLTARYEGELPPRTLTFNKAEVTQFGNTWFPLALSNGTQLVQLELYQPSGDYVQPGEYIVRGKNGLGTYDDFSVNKGFPWIGIWDDALGDYAEVKMSSLSSGTVNIALARNIYTMSIDLVFENGERIVGSYSGPLSMNGPDVTLDYELTSCTAIDMVEPAPNGFYYRFADTKYSVEMRLDLFSDGFSLKPGTYTFSNTNENGTASSNVDLYYPSENTKFKEGTVTVSEADGKTVVEIAGTLENELKVTAKYEGELPPRNLAFNNAAVKRFGNTWFPLELSNGTQLVQLELHQPSGEYVQPGEYVVRDRNDLGNFDDFSVNKGLPWIGIWDDALGDYAEVKMSSLSSGTVNIALARNIYTITVDLLFENGERIVGTYNGPLSENGPEAINYNLTSCTAIDVYEPAPNGFYYRFADSDYTVEMRIDLFSDGDKVAPGTYTFSNTNENGTASSNVDLYSPYENTKFKEGTVTVSEADGKTVVEIAGTLENELKVTAKYEGELPPRPTAAQ